MTLPPQRSTLFPYTTLFRSGRTTSACGLGIYRDDLPGTDYYGNAFICEPVHNLVHRLALKPEGVTFKGYRAPDSLDRKSTRLNSSHMSISYAVFCLKKKKKK